MRFTIRTKLALSSSVMVLLLIITGVASYIGFNRVGQENDAIVLDTIPIGDAASNILTDLINEETGVRGYLVTGQESFLEPYNAGKAQLQKDLDTIRKHEAAHPIMKDLMENQALPHIQQIQNYFESQINLVKTGKIEEARAKINDGKVEMDNFRDVYAKIQADVQKLTNDAWNNSKNQTQQAKTIIFVVSGIAVVFGITSIIFLFATIVRPIGLVNRQLRDIAEGEGDLTKQLEIKTKDELGDLAASFNKMLSSLRFLIRQVGESSEQVAASTEQLTASAEQTSKATEQITAIISEVTVGTETQAVNVDHSVKAMADLSAGIEQISVNAQRVAATAEHASKASTEGRQSIKSAIDQMHLISNTVNNLAQVIRELGDRSKEIGNIVEVITGIAEQTNLLALNAAIEAARAGEHGRGFAVVADEVRKLAEQSAESAHQITDLISTIQVETGKAVDSMESTTKEVAVGIGIVNSAEESFNRIQNSVNDVTGQIQEVSAATQQMSQRATQVVRSIDQISEVSEATAAGTQNVSAAAEEQLASMQEITASAAALAKMAGELQQHVSRFRV
ncbi:methyl-accepting chemotaxis protein [Effusibacillus dendaii]|uniref:Methyl-accepting chemotaxis protein n=1 Tax=Effusibacillus dendaii TaxID=2743772 RepID=A0A7I8DG78_9BACL|nr:methyl-accepting chemotaxis protein [Effusibacillus dendaii]BCJ88332.1 hypothetical protein skT53_33170 [Effusibacillus dendaii]